VTTDLLERAAWPLPSGPQPVHTKPVVVVGTPTAHPVDLVQVLLRRDGDSPLVIRALRDAASGVDPAQWFRAQLPVLEPDDEAEYRVEWLRAGRRIATLPADGSWYHLLGVADGPQATPPANRDPSSARPRFGYDLEFFATVTVNLSAQRIGATPDGYRVNFAFKEGTLVGPGVDAIVDPHGGDWMCVRPDGIGEVDIKITFRTRDGAIIFEQARGVFDTGQNGYAQMAAGTLGGAPPLYVTPLWSTAHPDWTWLNRRQGIGLGRVRMADLQVQCDIYLPTVQV
jgi:uncharacterized protein DUF3237